MSRGTRGDRLYTAGGMTQVEILSLRAFAPFRPSGAPDAGKWRRSNWKKRCCLGEVASLSRRSMRAESRRASRTSSPRAPAHTPPSASPGPGCGVFMIACSGSAAPTLSPVYSPGTWRHLFVGGLRRGHPGDRRRPRETANPSFPLARTQYLYLKNLAGSPPVGRIGEGSCSADSSWVSN